MKVIDRVVLVIAVLVMAFLMVIIFASASGPDFPSDFALALYDAAYDNRVLTFVFGVTVVLVMLYVLVLALQRDHPPKTIVTETGLGDVSIAMSAVETIARRVGRRISGIRDMEAQASDDPDGGLAIVAKVQLYPGANIPTVCHDLETQLTEAITSAVGVPVKSVHTVVRGVVHDHNGPSVK